MSAPFGVMLKPKWPHASGSESERMEYMRDVQRAEQKRLAHNDEIGQSIGATWYWENKGFPFANFRGMGLIVTRFYPQVSVAVDIFESYGFGKDQAVEIDFKRAAFRRTGVRYAALNLNSEVSEIFPQIGF